MRVVMLVESYFPRTHGGIEVYTRQLARELRSAGHEVIFACPTNDPLARDESADGVPVHFYPVPAMLTREEQRLQTRPREFEFFARWLDQVAPTVIHAHYLSGPAAVPQLEYARSAGIGTVLTVHFGTATCIRSTGRRYGTPMLRWGRTQCDGELRAIRCSACLLQARGLPRPVAWSAAALERLMVAVAPDLDDRIGSTATLPALVRRKRSSLEQLYAALDVVAVSAEWQRGALEANGLDPSRIRRVKHGTQAAGHGPLRAQRDYPVFGWAGRPVPEKGLEELLDAFAATAAPQARLRVACATSSVDDVEFRDRLADRHAGDRRIVWVPPFTPESAADFYGELDVFVAPYSMETGPLTVVEALAHGVPVIGSDVGGIRELVEHDVTGLLFGFRDAGALRGALVAALPLASRERWAARTHWTRSFAAVAADYVPLYEVARRAGAARAGARSAPAVAATS